MTTHNTLKFLREYAEEHKDGFRNGVEYIENRGFLDGFGVEAVLEGMAKQAFARDFDNIISRGDTADAEGEDPEWAARLEHMTNVVDRVLKTTLLFNSSSYGSNTLDLYKVKEAQKLTDKLNWTRALDKAE